jgi:hypothetical protein
MQNFCFPASTQMDVDFFFENFSRKFQDFSEEPLREFQKKNQIFDHFSRKFQNFLKKISKFSNSEKILNKAS